jgi:sulfur carrier protein
MSCTQCATIVVSFNGEQFATQAETPLATFLEGRGFAPEQRMACAVNTTFVPKSQYATTLLADCDRIDVVAPVQGG